MTAGRKRSPARGAANMSRHHHNFFHLVCLITLGSGILVSGGCARYHDIDAFVTNPERYAAAEPYTMAPPDMITILAPQVPEVNNTTVSISPDGTVTLPLLGHIYVAGKTPAEVAAMIEDRALEYYQEAEVVVRIASYRSKHIYVFGEVSSPGRYPYTGGDTLLDLLSRAQPSRLADGRRIHIFRRNEDGQAVKRMTVDLDEWYETGQVARNALLDDGDIVYVPPHGLARVALTLQQVLLPIQPIASTVRAPNTLDESTNVYNGSGASDSSSSN